jgi:hypothetical protein
VNDAAALSKSEHIAALARELLDDVELSRLSAEALVLKATRLARGVGRAIRGLDARRCDDYGRAGYKAHAGRVSKNTAIAASANSRPAVNR